MRRVLLPILLIVLFSLNAQAETYRISGKATYADNTPVALEYVFVECEPGLIDCYQYRGTKAITDTYGYFTLIIDVESEENDLDIQLSLRGENVTHTIDISKHQNSSENKVYQNIQLEQNPPPSGVFMGFGCFIVLFTLVFISVILRTGRRLSTAQGRMEFAGFRPARQLECPECGESVPQHDLVKHLIVDHDFDPLDAGQLTGKVMRRLWSEEE